VGITQLTKVRRACVLAVELERLERKFALAGEAYDIDLYQRVANSLRRLLGAVGLQRRSRDIISLHPTRLQGNKREPNITAFIHSDLKQTAHECSDASPTLGVILARCHQYTIVVL
jgi:hypothetical protein